MALKRKAAGADDMGKAEVPEENAHTPKEGT